MHALPGPKVKSNCEQFQCVVRAVPAMKEDQRESAVRDLADILDVNPARRRSAVRGGVEEGRPDREPFSGGSTAATRACDAYRALIRSPQGASTRISGRHSCRSCYPRRQSANTTSKA